MIFCFSSLTFKPINIFKPILFKRSEILGQFLFNLLDKASLKLTEFLPIKAAQNPFKPLFRHVKISFVPPSPSRVIATQVFESFEWTFSFSAVFSDSSIRRIHAVQRPGLSPFGNFFLALSTLFRCRGQQKFLIPYHNLSLPPGRWNSAPRGQQGRCTKLPPGCQACEGHA